MTTVAIDRRIKALKHIRWDRVRYNLSRHVPLLILVFLAVAPTYFMLTTSFKEHSEYAGNQMGLPKNPTIASYKEHIIDGDFLKWLKNSVIVTSSSVVLSLIVASLAAYPLSRMAFPGRTLMTTGFISLMVIPPIVYVIPLFVQFAKLDLLNHYYSAILIYVGTLLPFSTYLLTAFFKAVPAELEEAARMDGASSLQILRSVIIPLSLPALITLGVVNSLWVWNELLIALMFLNADDLRTLMIGVTIHQSRHLDIPLIMSGLILTVLPIIVVYIVGQRYFIKGATMGAVKE